MIGIYDSAEVRDTANVIVIADTLRICTARLDRVYAVADRIVCTEDLHIGRLRFVGDLMSGSVIEAEDASFVCTMLCHRFAAKKLKLSNASPSTKAIVSRITADDIRIGQLINQMPFAVRSACFRAQHITNTGSIEADTIESEEIESSGTIHAGEINCHVLYMKPPQHRSFFISGISGNALSPRERCSVISVIRARKVFLENVVCDCVIASEIHPGRNCQIKRIIRTGL